MNCDYKYRLLMPNGSIKYLHVVAHGSRNKGGQLEYFGAVRDALEAKFGEPESAKLTWKPQTLTPITGEPAAALLRLIDTLEDNDDVQTVYGNEDIAEAELAKLMA